MEGHHSEGRHIQGRGSQDHVDPLGSLIRPGEMSFQLEQNRTLSSVQSQKIGLKIYGWQHRIQSLRRLWSKVEIDKSKRFFMNHCERYIDASKE